MSLPKAGSWHQVATSIRPSALDLLFPGILVRMFGRKTYVIPGGKGAFTLVYGADPLPSIRCIVRTIFCGPSALLVMADDGNWYMSEVVDTDDETFLVLARGKHISIFSNYQDMPMTLFEKLVKSARAEGYSTWGM